MSRHVTQSDSLARQIFNTLQVGVQQKLSAHLPVCRACIFQFLLAIFQFLLAIIQFLHVNFLIH